MSWDDDNGHGTHVAGTVGAVNNSRGVIGVAPNVVLHAVKVLDRRGSAFSSEIIAGIDWVAAQVEQRGEAAVANISIGGSGSKTGTCNSTGFVGTNAYQHAMCNAAHVGVVFAVAAGNEDTDAANRRPASYDDTSIAVSAIGQVVDGDGVLTGELGWPSWSNWGDDEAPWSEKASAPVAIAAPGMGILSTWNDGGYNTIGGTSMASPHVAGALAIFLEGTPQSANYSAFTNARTVLLLGAELTTNGLFTIRSGNPHDEDFLDLSGL
jgi:subtilisin